MSDIIAKCGFDCRRCASYKENLRTKADRMKCSDGWHRHFAFRITAEKLVRCDGCLVSPDRNPVRYLKTGCRIRRCAEKNSIENCAYCSSYPCQDVKAHSAYIDREKIAARLGAPIPEVDYRTFIEPYEGLKHLDRIRRSLCPKDIVKADKVSIMPRIAEFPDNLRLAEKEASGLRAVHRLLAKVGSAKGISYVRQEVLTKTRLHILKILWAFGLKGSLEKKGRLHLGLDSETYLAQKINSDFAKLKGYFEVLKKHGAICKHVALKKEGWLTPKGGLRKDGWQFELYFSEKAGGPPALKALQKYVRLLEKKHGRNGFKYFARVDMRIFLAGE